MTDYVYPQRTVEQSEDRIPPDRWYSPLELRPWVIRALQYRPRKRKNSWHSHTETSEKWYSPLELRPWVVRAMGYRLNTREDSGQPHISPFRRYIEEIVAAKIAEHLGTETATNSSTAAETNTDDGGTGANLARGLEETLATLGRAEEGSARQHDSASASTAEVALNATEHALGALNSSILQFPIPRNPRSSRRESRKRLISLVVDFLMRNFVKLNPTRRPASASASASTSASESIAEEHQNHGVRSRSADTQPYRRNIWPWRSKGKNRAKGKMRSRQAGTVRRNSHRHEDRLMAGAEDESASDETSESELSSTTSTSAQVGVKESDNNQQLDQNDQRLASRPETNNVGLLSGRGSGNSNNNKERRRAESSTGRDRIKGRGRGRSSGRSRSRGRSWSRNGTNWHFHGLSPRRETRSQDF